MLGSWTTSFDLELHPLGLSPYLLVFAYSFWSLFTHQNVVQNPRVWFKPKGMVQHLRVWSNTLGYVPRNKNVVQVCGSIPNVVVQHLRVWSNSEGVSQMCGLKIWSKSQGFDWICKSKSHACFSIHKRMWYKTQVLAYAIDTWITWTTILGLESHRLVLDHNFGLTNHTFKSWITPLDLEPHALGS